MALNIAVIAGDGVGPEVIDQGLLVLAAAAKPHRLDYQTTAFDYGGGRYLKTGKVIDDDEVAQLRQFNAILLGAVGMPEVKPGILEKGLLLKLRFDLDQYINLRPVHLYEGVETPLKNKGPADIHFDVVRENTEDLYCGLGGIARKGTAQEVATQEMIATRFGVERCLRYAFELAARKKANGEGRGQLTLVHKTNVLTFAGDTWFRAFEEVGQQHYPDIERNYHHVDACCMYMATRPEIYDTIVVPNMFGDIITDLGAAIAGGMGVAASGNLNPFSREAQRSASGEDKETRRQGDKEKAEAIAKSVQDSGLKTQDSSAGGPSMFEPVHGSAPDIAGQGKANPLAAILSVAMLATETGRIIGDDAAVTVGERIAAAVRNVCPQFAGQKLDRPNRSTRDIGQMVIDAL